MIKRIAPICLILVACGGEEDSKQKEQAVTPVNNAEVVENEQIVPAVGGSKETVLADLDEDGGVDTIRMSNPKMAEPGDYDILDIIYSNGELAQFENPGLWDVKPVDMKLSTADLVASDRVSVVSSNNKKYLVAFGYSYGCCPRLCSVIELKGTDSKMFFNEELEVIEIGNIHGDEGIEVVGRSAFPEMSDEDKTHNYEVGDYCPYFVYSIEDMTIYEEAMEAYNEKHYLYLGPQVDTKIQIAYPSDGSKPYAL
jgi:hypothetical protein